MPRYIQFESLQQFAYRRMQELGHSGLAGYGEMSIDDFLAVLEAEYYDAAAEAKELYRAPRHQAPL